MKYRTFTVRLWFIYPTPRRLVTAAGPRLWAHFSRSCRDLHHTGRRGTVHRQAPCRAVSCRWAAAHPGAALGAWRVSPGAARASSQASARPLPQGRARRPSRSAPTTTGSSRTPSGTSRTLAVPSIHHTTSRADPLRPNAATGPRYGHALAPGPVPHRPAGCCSPMSFGRAGSPRAADPGGDRSRRRRLPQPRPARGHGPPPRTITDRRPRFVTPQARAAAGTTPTGKRGPDSHAAGDALLQRARRLSGPRQARPRLA
jgi:hypothetical protein